MPAKAPQLGHALHHAAKGLHLSPVVIGVIIVVIIVGFLATRGTSAVPAAAPDRGGFWVFLTAVFVIGATAYFLATDKPAKAPAPKVVTHVITHVVTRPGKPTLTGTEIVVIVLGLGALGLAYLINRGRS